MSFDQIWAAKLFSVSGQPITVPSVVLAALSIALGYFVARLASRLLARLLTARFVLEPGAAVALETLSFYFLFVAFAFTSGAAAPGSGLPRTRR
jgi:small-conductance mechanosensitive channel